MHQCEVCNAKFSLLPGSDGNDITAGRCPDCGSSAYRQLPTPLHSDMEIRDMPDAGGGVDPGGDAMHEGFLAALAPACSWCFGSGVNPMDGSLCTLCSGSGEESDPFPPTYRQDPGESSIGGDPLQAGFAELADGGWKNRKNRDESFASVLAEVAAEKWKCPRCGAAVYEDPLDHVLLCDHCGWGEDLKNSHIKKADWQQNQYKHLMMLVNKHPGVPVENLIAQYPWPHGGYEPQVVDLVKEQEETGGNANLAPLYPGTQSVMDMHQQMHVPNHVVEDNHSLGWTPGTSGRGLFVGDQLHTWPVEKTDDNPTGGLMHSEYLNQIGADPKHAETGFEIDPDGRMVAAWDNRRPDVVPRATQIDPNLVDPSAGFSFSRFATGVEPFCPRCLTPMIDERNEHVCLNCGHREPNIETMGYSPNFNDPISHPLSEGGPYTGRVADAQPQFEVEDVIPSGGHSVEAVPQQDPSGSSPGFHGGNLGPLSQLGVKINGEDVGPQFNQKTDPVVLSHPDPKVLDLAKYITEMGAPRDREGEYLSVLNPHHGQIDQPQGLTDDMHNALGVFNAAVENPETGQFARYQMYAPRIRKSHPGGPLRIATGDPELTRLLEEYSQTGDKAPLMAYQQNRTASTHEAWLGPIGDAVDKAVDVGQDIGLVPENLSLPELAGSAAWLIPGGMAARGLMTAGKLAGSALASEAVGGAAEGAGAATAEGVGADAANAATQGGGLLDKAKTVYNNPYVKGAYIGHQVGQGVNAVGQGMNQMMAPPTPPPTVQRSLQQLTHLEVLADSAGWHPSSDPVMHADQKEIKDGDNNAPYSEEGMEAGGSDSLHGLDGHDQGSGDPEFDKHFPKMFLYALSPDSAADDEDPDFANFVQQLAAQDVDRDGHQNLQELFNEFDKHLDGLLQEHDPSFEQQKNQWANDFPSPSSPDGHGHHSRTADAPVLPMTGQNPGHVPMPPAAPVGGQAPTGVPGTNSCPRCGAPMSLEATTCPACGSGTGMQNNMQNVTPAPPQSTPGMAPLNPQVQAGVFLRTCPQCGSHGSDSAGYCKNCGHWTIHPENDPLAIRTIFSPVDTAKQGIDWVKDKMAAKTAAQHMGPHNNEQFAAVSELLELEGRSKEIPEMLAEPWNYAEELARAQNKQIKPPVDDTLTNAPPAPAQEEAPPGATMPVPGMQAPAPMPMASSANEAMRTALERYATPDSLAPRCPRCKSGTTGIISEEGDCSCHACGHTFKKDVVKDFKTGFTYVSLQEPDSGRLNPEGVPAADQHRQHDIDKEQDSSLSWIDQAGDPLHVGEQYEMHIPGVEIPDIVRITAVKPDAIEVEYEGEYGIKHGSEIPRQEANIEGIEFTRLDAEASAGEDAPDPREADQMDSHQETGPGDKTDSSSPHIMMTHKQAADDWDKVFDDVRNGVYGDWHELRQQAVERISEHGNEPCPDCRGTGRDDMGSNGPDYLKADCPTCHGEGQWNPHGIGSSDINHTIYGMIKSGELQPLYAPSEDGRQEYENAQPQGNVPPVGMGPTAVSRTAGAKFTPNEQKNFIDEPGTARNRDKLNLAGTHYEESVFELDEDDFSESFLFGL